MKNGILLVAFGSTAESGKRAFENIEYSVKKSFPDKAVYWAFTSSIIRKKLKSRGENVLGVEEALHAMKKDGIESVTVQSLHVVPGEEFGELCSSVKSFTQANPEDFPAISIGRPLLESYEDLSLVAEELISEIPSERKSDEAVIWMGHGHEQGRCDLSYVAAESELQSHDPLTFVAAVEGGFTFDIMLKKLRKTNVKTVWLSPMMIVSGIHVIEDLIGDNDSWKVRLIDWGYHVKEHLTGMGEFPGIAQIFVNHIKENQEVK